tara:strand:+ start:103 stop:264 length:162 start_codon:yes stop_codon:yes gene_type:complete
VEAVAVDQEDNMIKVATDEQAAEAAVVAKAILAVLVVIVAEVNLEQRMEVLVT